MINAKKHEMKTGHILFLATVREYSEMLSLHFELPNQYKGLINISRCHQHTQ